MRRSEVIVVPGIDASTPTSEGARPTHASSAPRLRAGVLLGAVLAAGLAVTAFAPSLHNEFVYDDWPVIVTNPNVTTPGPWYRAWREPFWPRGTSADKLYRPLTVWSFRANVVLGGREQPDATAFRVVNIALHALTAAAVVLLVWRLTGAAAAGFVAGAIFATHPVHTEAVVTGYGRAEVLAGFFSAWLLVRHIKPAGLQRRSALFHVSSALLFLAAIMSKEHALFMWPAILLIDLWQRSSTSTAPRLPWRERLNRVIAPSHVGFALSAATYFFLRFAVFGQFYRLTDDRVRVWESPMAHASLIEHLLTPLRLLWLTFEVLVNPERLTPIWSIPALSLASRPDPDVIAGGILLLLLLGGAAVLWWRRSIAGALLGGLLLTLLIPIQALPMAHWIYAERWLYLPTVFAAAALGVAAARLRPLGPALLLAGAIVLLPAAWSYSAAFADNLAMNRETVRRQPDNFQGRRNLASVLSVMGEHAAAIEAANEVIERFPDVSDPYAVLIRSYLELGDGRQALQAIDTYERLRADIPEPSLTVQRRRAEDLISRSASRPAADTRPQNAE